MRRENKELARMALELAKNKGLIFTGSFKELCRRISPGRIENFGMDRTEKELAEERMLAVERQVHKHVPKGVRHSILCPYCGAWNFPEGRTFCCELLRKAVVTVLVADRALKAAESGERALVN